MLSLPPNGCPVISAMIPSPAARPCLAVLPAGPALAQQVPALVEGRFGRGEPFVFLRAGYLTRGELGPQLVFGPHELIDVSQDLLIVHGLHRIYGESPAGDGGRAFAR